MKTKSALCCTSIFTTLFSLLSLSVSLLFSRVALPNAPRRELPAAAAGEARLRGVLLLLLVVILRERDDDDDDEATLFWERQ